MKETVLRRPVRLRLRLKVSLGAWEPGRGQQTGERYRPST